MTRYLGLVGLLLVFPAANAFAKSPPADPPSGSTDLIVVPKCLIEPKRSTMLSAPEPGILQECLVQSGDVVKSGQILARLPDRLAQAERDLRAAQAAGDVEVRLAEARHALAVERLGRTAVLRQRNFSSQEEFVMQKLDVKAAALTVEDAKARRHLASLQEKQAEALVRSREIVAPHNGVVAAIFKQQGESVGPNLPILHLVDDRSVLVNGHLDVGAAWGVLPGRPVRVNLTVGGVDLDIEKETFEGRVVFVDRLIDPKTQTCRIVAEVENREGKLRPGLTARLEILPEPKPPGPASPPSALRLPKGRTERPRS